MELDVSGLSFRWMSAWGDCRPVADELRECLADRWVRFHSLPGSKRYAEDEQEYDEISRRHLAVLTELIRRHPGNDRQELLIITASWSSHPEPEEREPDLVTLMPATYWTSVQTDDSIPDDGTWTHLWVSLSCLYGDAFKHLLRMVADDMTSGVIITDDEMNWLYHPYDGGADVITHTEKDRDQLRHRYPHWLSSHPAGL